MATMTRSRTQVLRGYLPGQTFQHQNETIVKSVWVEAQNSGVDPDVLFENLAKQLQRWQEFIPNKLNEHDSDPDPQNRAPSFAELPRFQDRYELKEPYEEVRYVVWPLLLRCVSPACEKVAFFKDEQGWLGKNAARCDKCGSRREQMPYIQVHICGNDNTLLVPACEKHGMDHVYLKDERSFETSTWRCRAPGCAGRYLSNMRFQPCGCGLGGGYVSRTIRQEDRFITHTLSFVSFERAPRLKLARTPGADKVIVGYWLGLFDDYEQALLDAQNEPNSEATKARELRLAVTLAGAKRDPGAEHDHLAAMLRFGQRLADDGADVTCLEFIPPVPGAIFHAKIVCGTVGYLGSGNMTDSALGIHVEAGVPLGHVDVDQVWWLIGVLQQAGLLRFVGLR